MALDTKDMIIWEKCIGVSYARPKYCSMDKRELLDGQTYAIGTKFIAYESLNHSIIELSNDALDIHGNKPKFYFHRF